MTIYHLTVINKNNKLLCKRK